MTGDGGESDSESLAKTAFLLLPLPGTATAAPLALPRRGGAPSPSLAAASKREVVAAGADALLFSATRVTLAAAKVAGLFGGSGIRVTAA